MEFRGKGSDRVLDSERRPSIMDLVAGIDTVGGQRQLGEHNSGSDSPKGRFTHPYFQLVTNRRPTDPSRCTSP